MNKFDILGDIVWEDFTEAEYQEAANIMTTKTPAGHRVHGHRRQLHIPRRLQESYMDVLRIREHEWTHFRQHFSTPYGVFCNRLLATQEMATQMFVRDNPDHRDPINVTISERIATGTPLEPPLAAWLYVNRLAGVMWNARLPMETLISAWKARNQLHAPLAWLTQSSPPRELTTNRTLKDESIPPMAVSCEGLIEAFAAYRETVNLAFHFPHEDCVDYVARRLSPEARLAQSYLKETLGLGFGNPLAGALQDLAILGFVDPAMTGPGEPLIWEEIYPSARLEHAAREIARSGPPYPSSEEDAYWLAREAMGIDEAPDFTSQWKLVEAEEIPEPSEQAGLPGLVERIDTLRKRRMVAALQLRAECPFVYFAPEAVASTSPPAWRRFVKMGVPLLMVDPRGVSAPPALKSETGNLAVMALAAYATDDLARHGSFVTTVELLRRLRHPEERWEEHAHFLFEQMFWDGYHPALRAQVKEVFEDG